MPGIDTTSSMICEINTAQIGLIQSNPSTIDIYVDRQNTPYPRIESNAKKTLLLTELFF